MTYKIHDLIKFWQNVKTYKDTFIAEDDYEDLEKAGLFISEDEIKQNISGYKIHKKLPSEPFIGDLLNAKYFIITLNPGVDKVYKKEYDNWADKDLKKARVKNLNQTEKDFPFYYLHPSLEKTGGGKWWIKRLLAKNNDFDKVRKILAHKFCDLELCPYHSKNWSGKLTNLISSGKLKSSQLVIGVIKQIIADKDKIIFIRGKKDTGNVSKILNVLIPELKGNLSNVHYIEGRSPYLTPNSKSGKILYKDINK